MSVRGSKVTMQVATAKRLAAEAKLAARARRGFDAPDVIACVEIKFTARSS